MIPDDQSLMRPVLEAAQNGPRKVSDVVDELSDRFKLTDQERAELGQSGDNGVDGVIDQDPLGVDQIYLQAKRYGPNNLVGPGDIRNFYGALSIHRATKGIFVTTSGFTGSAVQTASQLGSRIVLIDGPELAKLMIRYNIGCRDKEVLHIKQVDEAYFEDET